MRKRLLQATIGLSLLVHVSDPSNAQQVAAPQSGSSTSAGPGPNTSGNTSRNSDNRSPNSRNSSRSRLTSQSSSQARQSNFSGGSNVPYMVGDTPQGAAADFKLAGSANVSIQHPSFGSSRLNVAENESPVVADRVYVNYRHFNNATNVGFFPGAPNAAGNSLDINAWTLGIERKFTDYSSLEFRLPIVSQLTSTPTFSQTSIQNTALPLNDTNVTIGNLGLLFKLAVLQTDSWYWTAGTALNLPTAPTVRVQTVINDEKYRAFNPLTGQPIGDTGVPLRLLMNTSVRNETVNLTPFLAGAWRPNDTLFSIGFLQLDVPLNESRISATGTSGSNGQVGPIALQGQVAQQVLLRSNLSLGTWLWKNDHDRIFQSCALFGEMHYTTTLNNADQLGPTPVTGPVGINAPVLLSYGNSANRVDTLNSVLGVQALIGRTSISNGFIAPIRNRPDRGYDFEYSLAVNRRF